MLKKRFITVILTLAVAVAIPCTTFAGELDADTTAAVSPTSIEKNIGDSVSAEEVIIKEILDEPVPLEEVPEIIADCLNADEMFTLAEGENEVVLNYTLKEGFRIADSSWRK